jgi:hypothetical protein
MTRLGEFSLIGRYFNLGSFYKIIEATKILGLLISTEKAVY